MVLSFTREGFEEGFYSEFSTMGDVAVSRKLVSGDLSAGRAEMARVWLDSKKQAEARRTRLGFYITIVASSIAATSATLGTMVLIVRAFYHG